MPYEAWIRSLEREWSPEVGFFWKARRGQLADEDLQRLLRLLATMELPEEAAVPRRLVSLLWYVPVFMRWQTDRAAAAGKDEAVFSAATTKLTNELERLLGVP